MWQNVAKLDERLYALVFKRISFLGWSSVELDGWFTFLPSNGLKYA